MVAAGVTTPSASFPWRARAWLSHSCVPGFRALVVGQHGGGQHGGHTGTHTGTRRHTLTFTQYGCTVHVVNEVLDGGPIVVQAAVPVLTDDTPDTLAARVLVQEHVIYPRALALAASGRLEVRDGRARVRDHDGDEPGHLVWP